MSTLKNVRSLHEAKAIFASISTNGHGPNVFHLSAAMSALRRRRQAREALTLFRVGISQYGIRPNISTYNAAISACEKGGQWQQALTLFKEMSTNGVVPNVITYSAVIEALPIAEIDTARTVCLQAMHEGHFQIWNDRGQLDLHLAADTDSSGGACCAAVARVLLYHTLHEFVEGTRAIANLTVVTGQGRGSGERGAVLPSSTRSFLQTQLKPSLAVTEVENNPGCFMLMAESIRAWVAATRSRAVSVKDA